MIRRDFQMRTTLAEILPVAENYLHSCNICLFYVAVGDSVADGRGPASLRMRTDASHGRTVRAALTKIGSPYGLGAAPCRAKFDDRSTNGASVRGVYKLLYKLLYKLAI
jgi:hypothetical protein